MGGYGPIPWIAIREYADLQGYGEDETVEFVALIREMDAELMRHETETKDGGR